MADEGVVYTEKPFVGYVEYIDPQLQRQWDRFHNDPSHTVWVLSNDGVSFRASRHRLKERSSLTELLPPVPAFSTAVSTFTLNFPAATVGLFLDMISTRYPLKLENLPFPAACSLYRLVAFARCPADLFSSARQQLVKSSRQCPLQLLQFASNHDDITLAHDAFALMQDRQDRQQHVSGFPNPKEWNIVWGQLRPSWQYHLKRLLELEAVCRSSGPRSWLRIRAGFNPALFDAMDSGWVPATGDTEQETKADEPWFDFQEVLAGQSS
ncbi:hypothetical protein IAU59_000864 [Kwoniella sp. CBS 9459]